MSKKIQKMHAQEYIFQQNLALLEHSFNMLCGSSHQHTDSENVHLRNKAGVSGFENMSFNIAVTTMSISLFLGLIESKIKDHLWFIPAGTNLLYMLYGVYQIPTISHI